MRCFIPLTPADLPADQPAAFAAGARGFADTPALQSVLADYDQEEREFAACLAAGDYSALAVAALAPGHGVLVGEGQTVYRRVVVAVDAPATPVAQAEVPGEVTLDAPVRWQQAVAILIDEEAAETLVASAHEQESLDALEDYDLLWFDITERHRLCAELGFH